MDIIITGAAGFIGSHLTAEMLSLNYKVTAIDNLSTGFHHNLDAVVDHPNLTLIIDDVQNHFVWQDYANKGDVIIHLAATVGVKKVYENSHETLTNNLDSTNVVLEVAKAKQCRVFFASTSEVYGQSNNSFLNETDTLSVTTTDQGRSSYVVSKLTNEINCLNYHHLSSVPVIIGRLFNAVGENQRSEFGMVIPTFIESALADKALIIYKDGSQRRSFCYVNDVIRAIIGLILEPKAWGHIFNIGNNTTTTIKELAAYIKKECNSKSEIVYAPMPPERSGKSEIYSRTPSTDKINKYIKWKPEVAWQESIVLIIAKKRELYILNAE